MAAGGAAVAAPLVGSLRWSLAAHRPDVWLRLVEVPVAGALWLLSGVVLGQAAGAIGSGVLGHITFFAWAGLSCALLWEAARAAGTALRLTRVEVPMPAVGAGLWVVAAGALVAVGGVALWGFLAITSGDGGAAGVAGLPLAPAWTALLLAGGATAAVLWRTARGPGAPRLRA